MFHNRQIIFIVLLLWRLQALSQLPPCKDSFPSSLLLNNSFEEYSRCSSYTNYEGGLIDAPPSYDGITINNWHSFDGRTWWVNYFNSNCENHMLGSIFDSTEFQIDKACSYYYPRVPMPLPDGNGFIGVYEDDATVTDNEKYIGKSYITYCLSQPLYAGQTYLLSFYSGFGTKGLGKCPMGYPMQSQDYFGVALFGRKDCLPFPLKDAEIKQGCLTNNPGWIQLGQVNLKGHDEWVTGVIEFTPKEDIYCLGIGPDCRNRSGDPVYYQTNSMHYMDKLVLAPVADFSFRKITALSGNVCTGHYVLQAPTYGAASYQWYKDGELIKGATSQTYTVPEDSAGNYVANIQLPYNVCVNTLPFAVKFTELNKFSLGNDTLLCTPSTLQLNAYQNSAVKYLWQDGRTEDTLSADRSGIYWVQLTDDNGCTKRDSINITIQNCDKCQLFAPTAFTPNGDGVNDVFRIKPQCPNVGLQNFMLRIYNRWGELVYISKNISKGWDGKYKGKKLTGVYVYEVDYSFEKNKPLQQKGTVMLIE